MARPWRVLAAVVVLFLAIPWASSSQAAASSTSTFTGIWGELHDLELDAARARLYVSDGSAFHANGVAVVDLATRVEFARIPIGSPTGLALSPSGDRLAVGSFDGDVYIVDPRNLTVLGGVLLWLDQWTVAIPWDLAFVSEDRLLVTLAQIPNTAGGIYPVIVLNLTAMAEATRFDESLYGFGGYASVHVDRARSRAYIHDFQRIWVYDVSQVDPVYLTDASDMSFYGSSLLSPDGTKLYFSSGKVYDAMTLAFLEDMGDTGQVALDSFAGYVNYASGPYVDRVRLSDRLRLGRFAFRGQVSGELVLDAPRDIAYVISGAVVNDRTLHAVPLATGLVDPYPADGAVWGVATYGISVVVSGDVDPAGLRMELDGAAVSPQYDPATMVLGYVRDPPLGDGAHHGLVTGLDNSGRLVQLEWFFSVDTSPPEIRLLDADQVFRETHVTIHGRIVDSHPGNATANDEPLVLNSADGSFSFMTNLTEGRNSLAIVARDAVQNTNYSFSSILHVPPTTRYVDADARFSVEYPSLWTVEQDLVVNRVRIEVRIRRNATGLLSPNLNVIRTGPLPEYSNAILFGLAESALANLSALPGFRPFGPPQAVSLPIGLAVTYSFGWTAPDGDVFQRQYVLANATLGESWVLTFTSLVGDMIRYDPLFQWIVGSFWAVPGSGASPAPVPIYMFIAGGAAAGASAAGVAWFLRRRAMGPRAPRGLGPLRGQGADAPPVVGEPPPETRPRPPSG